MDKEEIKDKIEENYRFNFAVNVGDGAFFSLGMGFIAVGTILPLFIRHLTNLKFYISMISAILMFGANIPQLLSAKYTRNFDRKKKPVLILGLLQRIPWLLLTILTFFMNKKDLLISFFIILGFYKRTQLLSEKKRKVLANAFRIYLIL